MIVARLTEPLVTNMILEPLAGEDRLSQQARRKRSRCTRLLFARFEEVAKGLTIAF
jgi:hypothetical protein